MDKILLFTLFILSSGLSGNRNKLNPSLKPEWKIYAVPDTINFRGISVPDRNTVWASGSGGSILRSIDAGRTWQLKVIPGYTRFDFRDIESFDSLSALVMGIGNPAVILKTRNGGRTWKRVYYKELEGIFLNSMTFRDPQNGFAVGDPVNGRFFLLKTTNGGESWEEIPENSRPLAKKGEYMFAASGTCIANAAPRNVWFASGGTAARVFHSLDNGRRWKATKTSIMSGTPSSGIFSILFCDNNIGFCIGGDYSRPDSTGITFSITRDGGNSWQVFDNQPSGYRSCMGFVEFKGMKILVAVGRGGGGYSMDGGESWQTLVEGFYTLDVDPSGTVCWAAGAGGKIGRLEFSSEETQ